MQSKSMKNISRPPMLSGTLQKPSSMKDLISLLEDFLARLSRLRDTDEASKIPEALSFLKYAVLPKDAGLLIWSWKTSRGFDHTTKEIPSEKFWTHSGDLTITSKRYSLTAKTSAFRKTENASSLSALLEENPDPKYQVSESVRQ